VAGFFAQVGQGRRQPCRCRFTLSLNPPYTTGRALLDTLTYGIMTLYEFIIRDPKVCGGEPVFRGTRVTLRTVLASLADGDSVEQIVKSFPTLSEQQVRAVIAFAAASVQEDLPLPELPAIP